MIIILQKVPYRTVHPDAPIQLWKQKGSDKEKVLRVVMLANPNVSVKDEWTKEEEVEEEEEGIGTLLYLMSIFVGKILYGGESES